MALYTGPALPPVTGKGEKMKGITGPAAMMMAALFVLAAVPRPAGAAGMSVGAALGYSWWDGPVGNAVSGKSTPGSAISRSRITPALMYGPSLSFSFAGRWGYSVVVTFGDSFRERGRYYEAWRSSYRTGRAPVFRYDLDSSVSCALNEYVKIVAAFRLLGYRADARMRHFASGSYGTSSPVEEFWGTGPAAGLAFTIPIAERTALSIQASGMYLQGRTSTRERIHDFYTAGASYDYTSRKAFVLADIAGGRADLSLAHTFETASLTVSLGGRYQILKYYFRDGSASVRTSAAFRAPDAAAYTALYEKLDGRASRNAPGREPDHSYGLTFSISYSTEFVKKSREEKSR